MDLLRVDAIPEFIPGVIVETALLLKALLEIEGGDMAFNPPLGEAAAERGYHLAQSAALAGDVPGQVAHGVRQTCRLRRDEEYRCLVRLTHTVPSRTLNHGDDKWR